MLFILGLSHWPFEKARVRGRRVALLNTWRDMWLDLHKPQQGLSLAAHITDPLPSSPSLPQWPSGAARPSAFPCHYSHMLWRRTWKYMLSLNLHLLAVTFSPSHLKRSTGHLLCSPPECTPNLPKCLLHHIIKTGWVTSAADIFCDTITKSALNLESKPILTSLRYVSLLVGTFYNAGQISPVNVHLTLLCDKSTLTWTWGCYCKHLRTPTTIHPFSQLSPNTVENFAYSTTVNGHNPNVRYSIDFIGTGNKDHETKDTHHQL